VTALQEKYFNAIYTRNVVEIKKCLEKGVNPNALSPIGLAPLHVLAERDDCVLGYRLMTHSDNIDLDLLSAHGYTALHVACLFSNKKFAVMLLQMGADPNKRDRFNKTALHIAVLRVDYSLIYNLLKYNADVNVMDCFENTPLSISLVQEPNLLIAKMLCKHKPDMDLENHKSTLHVFFVCHTINQIEFVMLLLDNGIDINFSDKLSGRICLHFVAISGYLELAVVLVEKGADLRAIDKTLRTPTKIAMDHGNVIIADYFQKGYRPPNLITALPLVTKWLKKVKKRVAERKAAEQQ
ncbi:ankyrin-1-like, partial [Asbolus verrucosus]